MHMTPKSLDGPHSLIMEYKSIEYSVVDQYACNV